MKKIGIGWILMLAALPLTAAELVEKIVARVNDQLITYSEFQKRLEGAKPPQGTTDPMKVKIELLDDIIKEKLLAERAKEMQVSATDAEVEEAVERVKRQYNLATDAEFDAALAQSKMTRDELKKQMRDTITLQKVVGRDVTSKLDISEDMLRLEYERQKEKLYRVPEQARIAEIVIRFPANDPAGRDRAAARVEEIRQKLVAGTSFADLAKQYSEGNARERGGDLGSVSQGELLPALDAAVFSPPQQEYPPPVLLPTSIHLYHVTDRKPAGFKRFEDVSEDLRKRINENLYERKFTEYMDHLRREAFVKIYDADLAKAEAAEKKS
jgi:peptidyl-prolyl cis-trans isomerase SurA